MSWPSSRVHAGRLALAQARAGRPGVFTRSDRRAPEIAHPPRVMPYRVSRPCRRRGSSRGRVLVIQTELTRRLPLGCACVFAPRTVSVRPALGCALVQPHTAVSWLSLRLCDDRCACGCALELRPWLRPWPRPAAASRIMYSSGAEQVPHQKQEFCPALHRTLLAPIPRPVAASKSILSTR